MALGHCRFFFFFFFNDTATTEIYTLSLHDALPISVRDHPRVALRGPLTRSSPQLDRGARSEEHTSELQSLAYLVCRLLLEKKKKPNVSKCRVLIAIVRCTRAGESSGTVQNHIASLR